MERDDSDREPRKPARAALDEQQRVGDGDGNRRDHPGGEIDDEAAQLRSGPAAVARSKDAPDDRLSREREEPGGRSDQHERDPGGRNHVTCDAVWSCAGTSERDGGHERDRGRRDRDEERRDQVRIGERRSAPRAEARREAQRDHVQQL